MDQEMRADMPVGDSTVSVRGDDGTASGMTSAFAVFDWSSVEAVVVIVTILVSYVLDGSSPLNVTERPTVVRARTTGSATERPIALARDCTDTGLPKFPERSRTKTS